MSRSVSDLPVVAEGKWHDFATDEEILPEEEKTVVMVRCNNFPILGAMFIKHKLWCFQLV